MVQSVLTVAILFFGSSGLPPLRGLGWSLAREDASLKQYSYLIFKFNIPLV